jgi:hypothetical protein
MISNGPITYIGLLLLTPLIILLLSFNPCEMLKPDE